MIDKSSLLQVLCVAVADHWRDSHRQAEFQLGAEILRSEKMQIARIRFPKAC
jgi:hypothetical protein